MGDASPSLTTFTIEGDVATILTRKAPRPGYVIMALSVPIAAAVAFFAISEGEPLIWWCLLLVLLVLATGHSLTQEFAETQFNLTDGSMAHTKGGFFRPKATYHPIDQILSLTAEISHHKDQIRKTILVIFRKGYTPRYIVLRHDYGEAQRLDDITQRLTAFLPELPLPTKFKSILAGESRDREPGSGRHPPPDPEP